MNTKKIALVLGGTIPHIELINELKSRDYYTILIDYYDNPPAKSVADEHIKESTLDKEKIFAVAINKKVDLVISTCIDQANVTACYVGEMLGLPIPYSYQTSLNVSDKLLMKSIMIDNDIPTSKFITVNDINNYSLHDLKYPLVVKPANSNSSKGVRKVNNPDELQNYLEIAISISNTKKAIIEEFVDGVEIGMDCFIDTKQAHIIMSHRKRKPFKDDGSVIYSIGSISPPGISEKAEKGLAQVANKIAEVFKLKNTPLLIQAIIDNDKINIVEFAPRIGGGLNFRTIKLYRNFDIIKHAVDSFLGIQVTVDFEQPNFFHSENHIYSEKCVFGYIAGIKELINNKTIEEFYLNKQYGATISTDMASSNRIGSFFVKADSIDDLEYKVREVFKNIDVFDHNNKLVEVKKIYDDLMFNL